MGNYLCVTTTLDFSDTDGCLPSPNGWFCLLFLSPTGDVLLELECLVWCPTVGQAFLIATSFDVWCWSLNNFRSAIILFVSFIYTRQDRRDLRPSAVCVHTPAPAVVEGRFSVLVGFIQAHSLSIHR